MQRASAALAAAALVVLVAVLIAYVWYNYTGWQSFSYGTGASPAWTPTGQADISMLRFKGCAFSVARGDGATATMDVTAVLNGMAVAYAGGTNNPPSLTLVRPLNPFSFVILGFNDSTTVSDPTAAPWCSAPPPSCGSDGACPLAVPGACSVEPSGTCDPPCAAGQTCANGACVAQGVCFSCAGGAAATLTGWWRTI